MAKITISGVGDVALLPIRGGQSCTETLSWLTEIQNSYSGLETSQQLRAQPRRTIEYEFFENTQAKADAFIAQYANFTGTWAVPLWFECLEASSSTDTVMTVDTTVGYDLSEYVLLYLSYDVWDLQEVVSTTSTTITVNGTIPVELRGEVDVFPVRLGSLRSVKRTSNGITAKTSILFDVDDYSVTEEDTPTQYKSYDLYTNQIYSKSETFNTDIFSERIDVDSSTGLFEKKYPWLNNRLTKSNYYLYFNQQDKYNFRRYLSRRKGKFKYFWEPSFEADLIPLGTGAIGTSLHIKGTEFADWDDPRSNIVVNVNGIFTPVEILSSLVVVDTTILTLDQSVSGNHEDINFISWLGLKRFNTDDIKITHGSTEMSSSISIVEVKP